MKKISQLGFFTLTMAIAVLLILPAAQAVDFKISGQVNRAVLWGDNGNDDDVKFVDNDSSSTRFRFTGSNDFNEVWTAGIVWEVEMQSNPSNNTSIDIGQNGDSAGVTFDERKIEFYIAHKNWGKIWLGQGSTASDYATEVDLSGTSVVTYSRIEAMAGGFNFRTDDDAIVTSVASAFNNFDGLARTDRIRYDTPKFGPVYFSTSYMNGQSWDIAGRIAYQWDGLGKLAGAVFYTGADTQRFPYKMYGGSASFLFDFGLNFTAAFGERYDDDTRDDDPYNIFGKVGYKFGKWALSVDYTYSENVGADNDEATSICGAAVFNPWKSVELYGAYRWHDLDRDNVSNIENVQAVMMGARIKF